MAGGEWLSQNKVRPGAYLNFKSVPKPLMTVGDRGIATIALPLSWGDNSKLIDVLSADMLDGKSLAKIGFTAFDKESKILNSMLSHCYRALVYRLDSGGTKATATIGGLVITAKYNGTLGNKINIAVVKSGALYEVTTYVNGTVKDSQKVAVISELEANDFVVFTSAETGGWEENAGTPLTTGTDGTVTESTAYPLYLALLSTAHWQTMACTSTEDTIKRSVEQFIEGQRKDEGTYVQAVLGGFDSADYEGVINVANGLVIYDEPFTLNEMTAAVAGMTAGANVNQSNTGKAIAGATQIVGEMTNSDIIAGLKAGKFIFSTNKAGNICVEQDINSLHTFTIDKNYSFSKNRVLRTLDEIGTTVGSTWDKSYKGKVDNNGDGRASFKGDLIAYGNELQRISAIQEFIGTDDISIAQGNDLDAVLVSWYVKPVDSMEKLYMEINVRG